MTQVLETKNLYVDRYAEFESEYSANGASWLHPMRKAALDRFGALGFPTTRDERWRFTNVAPIAKVDFKLAGPGNLASPLDELAPRLVYNEFAGSTLVFLNGHFAPALSSAEGLPKSVKVKSLADAISAERATVEKHLGQYADPGNDAFVALNTAYMVDGAFIHIPRGVVVEQPIHLLFVSTAGEQPTVSHPRNLIVVEENAQASFLETYASLSSDLYFTNAVTELFAGDGAVVDHYKLQHESEAAYHVSRNQVCMGRACNFSTHLINFGGRLARNEVHATLDGEGIECIVNGLTMIGGQQHVDNHMRIDHAKPHCASHELFKGVLDGKSSSVFSGRIIVRQDAQKTNAKQSSMNLLLSNDATANTQPQLEIFADDVKCTHGATIGQLDREAIFYLRARGISESEARGLLTYAFANDVVERIKIGPVRERLGKWVLERFRIGRNAGEVA